MTALICGVLTTAAVARPARAEPTPADQAAAEALFNEAHALIDQGRLDEACPKLLESHRLDPAAGTLLNLGDCYERAGRTASAWGAFGEAETMARNGRDLVREAEARRRAQALESKLSRLVLRVAPENRTLGAQVKREGRPVGEGLWGSAVPVDPGQHALEVAAPRQATWRTTVRVPAGPGVTVVVVPALTPAVAPPLADRAPPAGAWSPQRTVGVALGGLGVVGAAIGTVFGVRAASRMSDSEARCTDSAPSVCDTEGLAMRDEADAAAGASTLAFVLGGAALAGGVVLFATAPRGDEPRGAAALRLEVDAAIAGPRLVGSW